MTPGTFGSRARKERGRPCRPRRPSLGLRLCARRRHGASPLDRIHALKVPSRWHGCNTPPASSCPPEAGIQRGVRVIDPASGAPPGWPAPPAHDTTPEAFAALIRSDYDKSGRLVRDVGVRVGQPLAPGRREPGGRGGKDEAQPAAGLTAHGRLRPLAVAGADRRRARCRALRAPAGAAARRRCTDPPVVGRCTRGRGSAFLQDRHLPDHAPGRDPAQRGARLRHQGLVLSAAVDRRLVKAAQALFGVDIWPYGIDAL